MTAVARHRAEAAEPPTEPPHQALANAMLAQVEDAIRSLVEAGAEAQVRQRLARLLPAPMPAPAPVLAAPAPSAWEWVQIVTALRASRLPPAQTKAARAIVARHLAAATAAERRAAPAAPATRFDQETTR